MTLLAHDRYCDEIAHQVGLLRAVVTSGADLSATVPTCPDWSLEQLVRHMGGALRWVDALVRTRAQEEIPAESVPLYGGPDGEGDPAALDAWLAETGELVVGALREAGPDAKVWGWAGTLDSGFWARRMTHEITVHRADAALAAQVPYEVAPEVAADALDEWLQLVEWVQRNMPQAADDELLVPGRSIHLHASDTSADLNAERSEMGVPPPEGWGRTVELTERGIVWRRGHEKATVALRGPLTSVLLAFYRRLPLDSPRLEVLGERELLELWLEKTKFG
ncbi:maleylpyruvate isomerase family mycothiol-dependent enzyme [Streptomyces sp. ME18-1-4]|uniref:maleylpyruvate isomerase family mycothiol-dependent enzyme n=1 Tax=Streptomyces sp. ME18-1-4 TaxID=3028685 RepID=UPI0029A5C47D|nr:maleylpyruvate isomerase family mycothiol-dependent enzyme [Streptomyces sp. ME18-1-4]MDX3240953.1 maleylpyruvate isomerase family mycothiol-dependent enzyme [Streptomyces sp. ME18-1-4]